jgi:hypothetical protein
VLQSGDPSSVQALAALCSPCRGIEGQEQLVQPMEKKRAVIRQQLPAYRFTRNVGYAVVPVRIP